MISIIHFPVHYCFLCILSGSMNRPLTSVMWILWKVTKPGSVFLHFWLYSACILCSYLHIFSCFLVCMLLPVHMESFQLSALQIYISWKLMNLISLLFLADSAKSSRICYGFAVIFCLLGFCRRPLVDSPKDLSCNFSLPNSRLFVLFDAKPPSLA